MSYAFLGDAGVPGIMTPGGGVTAQSYMQPSVSMQQATITPSAPAPRPHICLPGMRWDDAAGKCVTPPAPAPAPPTVPRSPLSHICLPGMRWSADANRCITPPTVVPETTPVISPDGRFAQPGPSKESASGADCGLPPWWLLLLAAAAGAGTAWLLGRKKPGSPAGAALRKNERVLTFQVVEDVEGYHVKGDPVGRTFFSQSEAYKTAIELAQAAVRFGHADTVRIKAFGHVLPLAPNCGR